MKECFSFSFKCYEDNEEDALILEALSKSKCSNKTEFIKECILKAINNQDNNQYLAADIADINKKLDILIAKAPVTVEKMQESEKIEVKEQSIPNQETAIKPTVKLDTATVESNKEATIRPTIKIDNPTSEKNEEAPVKSVVEVDNSMSEQHQEPVVKSTMDNATPKQNEEPGESTSKEEQQVKKNILDCMAKFIKM
ncbi:hypothetical protein [Clostridium sp. ZS2-4]|uniref:hypothetical protein n=1 Tax=Clostridium sp. ZS2-4 TaxID=2987703 RepID=UPI00227AEC55|nr:hypothetical protein [Clostridium sp. ZS2-4]MCY6354353.1 hypothetical protein [Clostridium sp. ZS2-4]